MIPILVVLLGGIGAILATTLVRMVRRRRTRGVLDETAEDVMRDPHVGARVRREVGIFLLVGDAIALMLRHWWVPLLLLGGAVALVAGSGAIPRHVTGLNRYR